MPFYQPEQWDRLKETASDPEFIEASHGEWLTRLRRVEADMKRIGVLVRTVDVDVEEMAGYCEQEGIPNTREFRSQYAAELLRQRQLAEAAERELDEEEA